MLAITIYIGFRFRSRFAVGAIAATLHDVLVTLAFLQFFGYDLSLNVVAAILTITGYSVNDTIVIFDRVRENLRSMRREPLEQVVNTSVNQTLSRHASSPPAPRSCRCCRCSCSAARRCAGSAFTMLVGIISGTYSTVFIASAIAIILSQRKRARRPPRRRRERRARRGRRSARSSQGRQGLSLSAARSRATYLSAALLGSRPGAHRVPAHFVDGAPAARRRGCSASRTRAACSR